MLSTAIDLSLVLLQAACPTQSVHIYAKISFPMLNFPLNSPNFQRFFAD